MQAALDPAQEQLSYSLCKYAKWNEIVCPHRRLTRYDHEHLHPACPERRRHARPQAACHFKRGDAADIIFKKKGGLTVQVTGPSLSSQSPLRLMRLAPRGRSRGDTRFLK